MFRPKAAEQMTTPLELQRATYKSVYGVNKKVYEPVEGVIFCNFKTKGGTEKTVNDILVIEDTAEVVTWYRPDITSDCRIKRLTDNALFEIINEPENIEMRNQFLKFKVRRIKGGV
jgi:hypothetical protein